MEGLFEDRPDCALRTLDNAQAALQQLRQAPVDLLLLDLQMPGMDGFECYQRLRADPALQALPVVAVSADANPATIERCRALGFAGYVTKPVDAGCLQAAVDQALATLLH
jgi:CheY-like chemotaxis protein